MSMPHSIEAERAVLSAVLLLGGKAFAEAADVVTAEHFYLASHADIWTALARSCVGGRTADTPMVRAALESVGKLAVCGDDLDRIGLNIPSARNLTKHCEIVRDYAATRDVIEVAQLVAHEGKMGPPDVSRYLDTAAERVCSAAAGRTSRSTGTDAAEAAHESYSLLTAIRAGEVPSGYSSGLTELDSTMGKLRPGTLIVLAGRPGMGKSALAQKLLTTVAEAGVPSIAFSFEMPKHEWLSRMASARCGVGVETLLRGGWEESEAELVAGGFGAVSQLPFHIEDSAALTILDIRSAARQYKRDKGKLGVVLIDYVGLVKPTDSKMPREQQVAEISRESKAMAKELECTVLLLAQLNRDGKSRGDKRPILSDLRESGALEQDADAVLFVFRAEEYDPDVDPGEAQLIVAKNRNGGRGIVRVAFIKEQTKFANLDRRYDGR